MGCTRIVYSVRIGPPQPFRDSRAGFQDPAFFVIRKSGLSFFLRVLEGRRDLVPVRCQAVPIGLPQRIETDSMQAGSAIRPSSFLRPAVSSTDELKFFPHAAKWPGEEVRPDRNCPAVRDL